jgi:hypothetical protein
MSIALEALAGLARVARAQGKHPQAQAYVDEIVAHLETGGRLDGAEEPFRIYLTCFQVLEAGQDDRASTVLATAYRQLQAQAAKIGDEELRRSFLENVAAHRELAAAVARVFPDGLPPEPEEAPEPAEPVEAVTLEEAPAPAMPELAPEAVPPAEVAAPAPAPAAAVRVAEPASPLAEAPVVAEAPVQPSVAPVATRPVAPSAPMVDLRGAGLVGAVLNVKNLAGWCLAGADLSRAQLRAADLRNADLRGASLREADLRAADLRGAQLRGADLTGVVVDQDTQWPEGFTPPPEAVRRD